MRRLLLRLLLGVLRGLSQLLLLPGQFLGGRGELLIAHDRTRAAPVVECTGDHLLNS